MSRRRHKNRNKQQPQRKQESYACRYVVSLAEWKQFEKFKATLPTIEEELSNLQENWSRKLDVLAEAYEYNFDDITLNITKIVGLIKGEKQKYNKVNRPNKRYDNMVAEIIIDQLSDDIGKTD
jgi:hypothetical protein